MRMDDLDFELPEGLIAQRPADQRDGARLLDLERAGGRVQHRSVRDLPTLLEPGDLLVVNDTRVLPAKLAARRATGGRVDFLLLHPAADGAWTSLVRCGGSLQPGEVVRLEDGAGICMLRSLGAGEWLVRAEEGDLRDFMQADGRMPLPPYIQRTAHDARDALDRERYQTVFARADGAVAAPTAGLHLTPELLAQLAARGIEHTAVTLHVGLGTFAPVRSEMLEDHPMHAEHYEILPEAAESIRRTKAAGGRIVAVGTTTVRTLEASAARAPDHLPIAERRETDLLIAPGFPFRVVDVLLTNFHLPRSTLLALVGAFVGMERMRDLYRIAIAEKYRFFSYGDAMLLR
jgi:S-adenosylmethionine:tRNA ribosyltransferase-isomerase